MFWWWLCAWTCGGDGVGRVAVAAQEERERELYFFWYWVKSSKIFGTCLVIYFDLKAILVIKLVEIFSLV